MLKLRTFGGLSIENDAAIGNETPNRRPLALLALLAVGGRQGLGRDKIVGLLWPESDAEHGRNSLSQVLSSLRRELAVDDIVVGTTELRLNSDVLVCDVMEFEHRIAADDLEAAIRLYSGPFLDGVFLKNTPEFERWVDRERSRLQHAHSDALERLAARATASGDHVAAVRFWRQRASLAPGDSRAARQLMESLVASGDPAGALAHYRVHGEVLRDDLGVEPDPTLAAFATAVRLGNIRSVDAPAHALRSTAAAEATSAHGSHSLSSSNEPALLARVDATVSRPAKRRRVLLPIAAAAVLMVGVAVAWGVNRERFSFVVPPPPAHDSLRLRVVTAALQSDPADATLARQVRDAALAEMEKDPWLFVERPAAWLQRAPWVGLSEVALADADTIRKYARKTRTHVIVDFGVARTTTGFVITAEARGAATDSSLGVIAEAAGSAIDLPAAINRLGGRLRERLVASRSSLPPTQWSLSTTDEPSQAVELYIEGRSEGERRNWIEAARRHGAAVRVDSTFAQAWILRYAALVNAHLSVADQLDAISAAFRFRSRVRSAYERLNIAGSYFRAIGDPARALAFYDSMTHLSALRVSSNIGLAYGALRQYDLATLSYRQLDTTHKYITVTNSNFVRALLEEGNVVEARREVAALFRADSTNATTVQSRHLLFTALRDWESLRRLGQDRLGSARTTMDSANGVQFLRDAAIARGEFALFDSLVRLNTTLLENTESSGDYVAGELERAQLRATVAGDVVRARAIADSAIAVAHWESLRPMDRPYVAMLLYLASIRDTTRGAEMAREWSRTTPVEFKLRDSLDVLVGRGELALSSGNGREALRLFRIADVRGCAPCFFPRYARAFDAIGQRDSARVWFERYAAATHPLNALGDALELAHSYRRLGELYEERGDVNAAVQWYERFIALWAGSDTPALLASVRTIRGRVDKLRKAQR